MENERVTRKDNQIGMNRTVVKFVIWVGIKTFKGA